MEENQVGKKGRKERKRVREEEIEGRTEGNRHGDGEVRKNLIIFPYVGKNIRTFLVSLFPSHSSSFCCFLLSFPFAFSSLPFFAFSSLSLNFYFSSSPILPFLLPLCFIFPQFDIRPHHHKISIVVL